MAREPEPLRGIHVLLVEDHPDTLEMYEEVLRALGAQVTSSRTPSDALARCDAITPDIVVTDLTFGGLKRDGVWLLHELRRRSKLGHVPVVGVTGRDLDAAWQRQHEFNAVLIKPVDPIELVRVIASLVRRTQSPG
jgi:two-component system CheB/CheR fusion protein